MSEEVKQGEIEINPSNLGETIAELVKDPSLNINKPSDAEVAEAQKEFEKAAQNFTIKQYSISKPENAQEFTDYIRHFIENRFLWQKEAWMGTIKLSEELDAAEGLFKADNTKGLQFGYQALEFVFYALSNPAGIGLAQAKGFEEENEMFIKVASACGEQLEGARAALKEIEFLQQKWGAMAQGFYLEVEPEEEEELPDGVEEAPEDAEKE